MRIDTWVESGCEVPPFFDPLLAKVITCCDTRDDAVMKLDSVLQATRLYGVETNRQYLQQILTYPPFASGFPWTRCLEGLAYNVPTVEVLSAGTQTTVQDFPGRQGYWAVGVPPSGAMDAHALRLGNRLLGNDSRAAALEITMTGPALRFNTDAVAVVTGAAVSVELDGNAQAMNQTFLISAGMILKTGDITGPGARSYLCLRGGISVPEYLGSKSTFTLGQFGGHGGRALRAGDILHLHPLTDRQAGEHLPDGLQQALPDVRVLRVIYGPHGAPEYFTPAYMERFFATEWEVHFNSSRTGVRLIGPKPEWVRESGGEAGLHPSNIHDNPYAIGAVDFTGDMPVILGPDGPSLGGFVCPVTVIEADLCQLGQLKAGDRLRFVPVDVAVARHLMQDREKELKALQPVRSVFEPAAISSPVVLDRGTADKRLVARLAGDTHLLLEIGAPELNLVLRFRGHALMQALAAKAHPAIIDLTPGIRSLQIHYQPEALPLHTLLPVIESLWDEVCAQEDLRVSSRIVYLPLSWDDPACQLAIDKYMTTVRRDAPWCPSNLEFIRRINDLPDIDEVYRTVFAASYLVVGLGDVYLGAPVATPLDPRHRLVTTKYNPARTWTAENSVGIGGAYLCVYGMEGPGGYQFVGRTLQMWNRYRNVADFGGKPWLLRFFDQIRFYPVSADELTTLRRDFPLGRYPLRIEHTELALADYQRFLEKEAQTIADFRSHQQSAFNAERERWIASGQAHFDSQEEGTGLPEESRLQPGELGIESTIAGNLWQLKTQPGERVKKGDVLAIIEAMKMEIPLLAPCDGVIAEVRAQPGNTLRAGQCVVVMNKVSSREAVK